MPKRARFEKAVGSTSPETFTTRFATNVWRERQRQEEFRGVQEGRSKVVGCFRKRSLLSIALGILFHKVPAL